MTPSESNGGTLGHLASASSTIPKLCYPTDVYVLCKPEWKVPLPCASAVPQPIHSSSVTLISPVKIILNIQSAPKLSFHQGEETLDSFYADTTLRVVRFRLDALELCTAIWCHSPCVVAEFSFKDRKSRRSMSLRCTPEYRLSTKQQWKNVKYLINNFILVTCQNNILYILG